MRYADAGVNVAAADQVIDDICLVGAEAGIAEHARQYGARLTLSGGCLIHRKRCCRLKRRGGSLPHGANPTSPPERFRGPGGRPDAAGRLCERKHWRFGKQ